MDRRQFLVFGSVAPILAACGGGEDGAGPSATASALKQASSGAAPLAGAASTAVQSRFTAGTDGRFLLDGKPFVMAAGELHPQRIPSEYWDHRIKMVKALGFNAISIYDFWSEHVNGYDSATGSPIYDFSNDRNNLAGFLDLCKSNNMWVFLRPGPFVDAYWDLGGIPGYLLATDGIKLRSSTDKTYMTAVESYISTVAAIVASRLTGNGGPVLMVQVENEYTSYGYDKQYLSSIRALWEKYGIGGSANNGNVLLSTNNGINGDGSVFSAAAALTDQPIGGDPFYIDAGPGFSGSFDLTYALYKQPSFSAETYSGWDTLGSSTAMYETSNADSIGVWIDRFLHKGVSFAVYVAHGGTSFGYGAAGNYDSSKALFDPNVTSYDYRAPINEQGSKAYNIVDPSTGNLSKSSFDDMHTAFASALAGGTSPDGFTYVVPYSLRGPLDAANVTTVTPAQSTIPAMPDAKPMIALSRDQIALTPLATLWDNLPNPVSSTSGPLACESVGMYAGCGAVYSTTTPSLSGTQYLTLSSLADVATVFLNGALAGIIDRRNRQGPALGKVSLSDASSGGATRSVIQLDFGATAQAARIDIFVYTFGHTHKEFTGISGDAFRKGIWGGAYLTPQPSPSPTWVTLTNWSIYPLPMQSPAYVQTLKPLAAGQSARAGMFYSAAFHLDAVGDTYVDVSTWNLGVVWVNGHNIGRHFASASPQKVLFCPATCLVKGANQIVIFDNYVTDVSKVYVELTNVQSTYNSSKVVS